MDGGASNVSNGIVLPMSNQIGAHFNLGIQGPKINNISVPIVLLGLGAQNKFSEVCFQSIPSESIEWIQKVAESTHNPNIAVRGYETKKFLDRAGLKDKVVVLGCPSLLINPRLNLGEFIKNRYYSDLNSMKLFDYLSIAAGDPHQQNYSIKDFEINLIRIVERYSATYIIQNPDILISRTTKWFESSRYKSSKFIHSKWFPDKKVEDIDDWFRKYAMTFFSVPQWIYYLSNRSLVIGTRIHGVQAAIQAGTPAICFYVDSRTKELCETMKIPHASAVDFADSLTLDDCKSIIDAWDAEEFDANRLNLAKKTKDFFISNNIEYSSQSILSSV